MTTSRTVRPQQTPGLSDYATFLDYPATTIPVVYYKFPDYAASSDFRAYPATSNLPDYPAMQLFRTIRLQQFPEIQLTPETAQGLSTKATTYTTRQSEMANTSPRHMPVLGNVHPIKIEHFDIFS